ncbi:unnamed protein product, partial [Meganyctiphanes norvegica]
FNVILNVNHISAGRLTKFKEFSKGIPASQNPLPGPTSGFVSSTPAPIVYVPLTLEMKFELDEIGFTPILADHESEDFKKLTEVLEDQLKVAIKYKYASQPFTLKLIKFESSKSNTTSTTVRLRWENEDEKKMPSVKEVTEMLTKYLSFHDGHIGGNHISSKTLNVENLVDECKTSNRTSCTHLCDFQKMTLLFKCSCPDSFVLQNEFNCVDRHKFSF